MVDLAYILLTLRNTSVADKTDLQWVVDKVYHWRLLKPVIWRMRSALDDDLTWRQNVNLVANANSGHVGFVFTHNKLCFDFFYYARRVQR